MTPAGLLESLAGRGVVVVLDGPDLDVDAPEGVLTDDDLANLRTRKAELVRWFRTEGTTRDRVSAVGDAPAVPPGPTAGGAVCPWCGPVELLDDPEGLRCGRCERLAWVCDGGSLIRTDYIDDDLEGLAPDDVPTCPNCGRWCDTETVTGAWLCSRCGPDAEARRRRTRRVLDRAERLRSR